jgi:hypothetical protein
MATPAGSDAAHRPIFIVGSNGSGSTLLRLILDSHESIAIPEETGFLRLALTHRWVPYWRLGGKWFGNLGLSDDQLYAELGRFYGGLFAAYAAGRGKTRWGDKTPFHVWHLQLGLRMFPEAIVVGIIRHPGGVVASTRRRFRRPPVGGAVHWMRSNRQLLFEAESLGDRCVLLRYEDLVLTPEPVLRALLERIGEPWSPAVLTHHEVQPAVESTGFTRADRPIDASAATAWEAELGADVRDVVVARTGVLAAFLGYDPARGTPVAGFGDDPSTPLLSGTVLAERKRTHPEINWSPPGRWPEDRPLRGRPPRRSAGSAAAPNLDNVTIRTLLEHRLRERLSPRARAKANEWRRSRPVLDRLFGPR